MKQVLKKIKKWKYTAQIIRCIQTTRSSFNKSIEMEIKSCSNYQGQPIINKIRKDMKLKYIKYRIFPSEYIDFDLFGKSKSDIISYISMTELFEIFAYSGKNTFPKDKYERYIMFKEFYHREILKIDSEDDNQYNDFVSRHDKFICKPLKGTKGHGVCLVSFERAPKVSDLNKITPLPVIAEELIRQGNELSQFHPKSVNTVRLVTAMNAAGDFYILFALLRVGQGDSVTDNVGSGGLICMIDIKNGIVDTDALYHHSYYSTHPDTKIKFKGTVIPEWEELLLIAERAHRTTPKQAIIGWDFAWTVNNGWDLIEENPVPSLSSYQTLSGKGIRPLLEEYKII